MLNKILKRKVELETTDGIVGEKGMIQLEYYLVESEIKKNAEFTGEKAFGIEIVKKVENDCEVQTIKNLSLSRDNTLAILEKLAANTVTPIGLCYVLDDMIGV